MPGRVKGALKQIPQNVQAAAGSKSSSTRTPQAAKSGSAHKRKREDDTQVPESKMARKRQEILSERERVVKRLRVAEASERRCSQQLEVKLNKLKRLQVLNAAQAKRQTKAQKDGKRQLEEEVAKLHSQRDAAKVLVTDLAAKCARLEEQAEKDGKEAAPEACYLTEDLIAMSRRETLKEPSALLAMLGRLRDWARRKHIRSNLGPQPRHVGPEVEYDFYVTIHLPEAGTDEENADLWLERTFQRALDDILFGDDVQENGLRPVAPRVRALGPHPSGAGLLGTLSLAAVPWELHRGIGLGTPENRALQAGEALLKRAVAQGGAVQRRYRAVETSGARIVRRPVNNFMGLGAANCVAMGSLDEVAEWLVGQEKEFAKGTQPNLLATPSGAQTLSRIRLLVERFPSFLTLRSHRDGVRELLIVKSAGYSVAEAALRADVPSRQRT